jgi:thiopurine S-methyltransferase
MELDFWQQRWLRGETGFHQPHINPWLGYYYGVEGPPVEIRNRLRVFVPLCGKTADMAWLVHNGFSVVGVECSSIAVQDFFREQGMQYRVRKSDRFEHYIGDRIEILHGDFFELRQDDLGIISDVFDRASLIALPPEMRADYVRKLSTLLPAGTRTLLITLSYPQQQMDGPPFSVDDTEVVRLYGDSYRIDKLAAKDTLAQEPRFMQRGLTSLTETAYRLTLEKPAQDP